MISAYYSMISQSAQRKNTFTIEDTTFNNGIWESDAQESLKSIPQTCKYGLVRCPILYESQVFIKAACKTENKVL